MRGVFGVGPEASCHLAVDHQFVDTGYDHLTLINAGLDPEGFFDFFAWSSPNRCGRLRRPPERTSELFGHERAAQRFGPQPRCEVEG
jgi:hypothetical protein